MMTQKPIGRPALGVGTVFGAWLREERTKRGLTGEMLAFRVNEKGEDAEGRMTQGMISGYERGAKMPTLRSIILLADALAGPDATDETRERLRAEARAAAAGIEIPDLERVPGELEAVLLAYSRISDQRERDMVLRVWEASVRPYIPVSAEEAETSE